MRIVIFILFTIISVSGYSQNENYPIPQKTEELLFYIQRNHNANTIIYDANFDKDGNLINEKPIDVYWLRYDEQGQRMELRPIEKWYAYGVSSKKVEGKSLYKIELVADKESEFWLKQIAVFKAIVITKINNKLSKLEHLYILADNSGIWPQVKYIELFGKEIETGEEVRQKIIND